MGYVNAEGAQVICPAGSHIPSDNDWKILEISLSGMSQDTANQTAWHGTDEGTKLKADGLSGLNFLLGGNRYEDGSFFDINYLTVIWSSSEDGGEVWRRYLDIAHTNLYRAISGKLYGYSVRCLGN